MKQIDTTELSNWLEATLQPQRFKDYCPNGLQVQGKSTISHIITGVTASRALLGEAIRRKADAIFVHHGWFWRNEDARLVGIKRERIALALQHNLNLFAYHLPLDAHPQLGNNAQLGRVLGFTPELDAEGNPRTCGPEGLIWLGRCDKTLAQLGQHVGSTLKRQPLIIGDPEQHIERIAWCTGGAQGFMQDAIDAGAQAYLTGEASEPNFHLANETGVAFVAAGHHATERYGAQAVGQAIQQQFGIQVEFVDLDNPV